ncbi:hypothetical protein IC582_005203 [Cucumis melo]
MERHNRRFSISFHLLLLPLLLSSSSSSSSKPHKPAFPQILLQNPHLKFPKSSCDSAPHELVSIDKKNERLWSSNDWKKKLSSFINFFQSI